MSDKKNIVETGVKTPESRELTRKELEKVVGGTSTTQTGKTQDKKKDDDGGITLPEI